MSVLLWIAGVALVVIGIAGIVFPALPGHVLIFAGLLLAAWADNFARVGPWTLVVIGVIGAASYAVDFVAAALGARHVGASRSAVVGAGLGTLLGIPFGLPGVVFGPLVGAVLGELSVNRQLGRAAGVGMAAWIGFLIGTAVKVALAFLMIGVFVIAVLWL
ncbi:MAG TPA: DUF456 domain-containing protein [Vicinamibacterales bacterium]|nr:DUF456 domain-containing protein [Vicinamibacterales bacterium]